MATIAFIGSTKTVVKAQEVSSNVLRIVANTIFVDSANVLHFLDRAGWESLAKTPSIGCVREIYTSISWKSLFHIPHTHSSFSANDVTSPARSVVGLASSWGWHREYSSRCKHSAAHVPYPSWNDSGDVEQFQNMASYSSSRSRSQSEDHSRINIRSIR